MRFIVTGRCISMRQFFCKLSIAKEYAAKYRDCEENHVIYAIAVFWLSLADYYFECGKVRQKNYY